MSAKPGIFLFPFQGYSCAKGVTGGGEQEGGQGIQSPCVWGGRGGRPLGEPWAARGPEAGPAGGREDGEWGGVRPSAAELGAAGRALRERSPRVPVSPLLAVSGRLPAGPDLL